MASSFPRSGAALGLAVFVFVIVVSASGILYASLQGSTRTVALACLIGVELLLAVAIGLYLRNRSRSL